MRCKGHPFCHSVECYSVDLVHQSQDFLSSDSCHLLGLLPQLAWAFVSHCHFWRDLVMVSTNLDNPPEGGGRERLGRDKDFSQIQDPIGSHEIIKLKR